LESPKLRWNEVPGALGPCKIKRHVAALGWKADNENVKAVRCNRARKSHVKIKYAEKAGMKAKA